MKGKCFEFTGRVSHVLDRTTALFTIDLRSDTERTCFLDFGAKAVPPVPFFEGYVKGEGTFEYTAALGPRMIVPKLRVISID